MFALGFIIPMIFFLCFYYSGKNLTLPRAVKRVDFSGFGLVLMGFGLNGPSQKSSDLNGLGKLRT